MRNVLSFFIGLLGFACVVQCGKSAPVKISSPTAGTATPTPAITINVDKREALFGILFRMAGAPEYHTSAAARYVHEVDTQFEPFKNHPAVQATQALRASKGISFNAPQSLLVYVDDHLMPRRKLSPLPPGLDARWTGVNVDEYLAKVRDFAQVSHADAFFAAHDTYYRAVESRFRQAIERANLVAWFDRFFGPRPGTRYIVVPGLLNGGVSYSAHAEFEDGHAELYQMVSLGPLDADELPKPNEDFMGLLVHELAHSYVNPFLDSHVATLQPHLASILKWVEPPMRKQAYNNPQVLGNESLVRAVVVLYVKDTQGPEGMEKALRDEAYRSFLWVGDLANVLETYRTDRNTYPTLEAFFPKLQTFFAEVAQRLEKEGVLGVPFSGPINAGTQHVGVVIGPTVGPAPQALRDYVRQVHDQFFSAAALVEPIDPPGLVSLRTHIILYGSPPSNPFLSTFLQKNHLQVTPTGISVAGKHFTGDHLVLIACRPHPTDMYHGVLVYTAARDADLIGVNSLFHGPTDWVVANRLPNGTFETIATGNFKDLDLGKAIAKQ